MGLTVTVKAEGNHWSATTSRNWQLFMQRMASDMLCICCCFLSVRGYQVAVRTCCDNHYIQHSSGDSVVAENDGVSSSFFVGFPKVPLVTLLNVIYYFIQNDSQRRIAQTLNLRASLLSRVCRRPQDVCSMDLQTRPIVTIWWPGCCSWMRRR